eukprot:scaffold122603_cov52-Prasinocladus_malaysianus.AAC.1
MWIPSCPISIQSQHFTGQQLPQVHTGPPRGLHTPHGRSAVRAPAQRRHDSRLTTRLDIMNTRTTTVSRSVHYIRGQWSDAVLLSQDISAKTSPHDNHLHFQHGFGVAARNSLHVWRGRNRQRHIHGAVLDVPEC